jgi:hypothetical protein
MQGMAMDSLLPDDSENALGGGSGGAVRIPAAILVIKGETIVRSWHGPFEVEYAMFTPGDLKLGSSSIGQVRELGYETTVESAIQNLHEVGASSGLADRVTMILRGSLGEFFARGPSVFRHVGGLLAHQLLLSSEFGAEYNGGLLDLEALNATLRSLGSQNVGGAIQALGLAALLSEIEPGATVSLQTEVLTAQRPSAFRSFTRVKLPDMRSLPDKLLMIQKSAGILRPIDRERGLSRTELATRVRREARYLATDETKARLVSLEAEILTRTPRATGPLSDPDLWLIEATMDEGRTEAVDESIHQLELDGGKTPATAYLRARSALLQGTEDPRAIAERITSLALSMSSFIELEVLASEAWLRASEWKRALPFARDVLTNPAADEVLRSRAARVAQAAEDATAGKAVTDSVFARPAVTTYPDNAYPSVLPRASSLPPAAASPKFSEAPKTGPAPAIGLDASWSAPPARLASFAALSSPIDAPQTQGVSVRPSAPPTPRTSEPSYGSLTSEPMQQMDATETVETEPRLSLEPSRRTSSMPPNFLHTDPGLASEAFRISGSPMSTQGFSRGGTLPAFTAIEVPAGLQPRVSVRAQSMETELAEHLEYPGMQEVTPGAIPRTAEDARKSFTKLTRDMAADYRETLGITLRLDLGSLEAIQNYLAETLPTGAVRTPGEAREIRRHGAFMSEMLARRLGAQWTDLSSDEVGHWTMSVSPNSVVYPFGRIVRFVRMLRKERDLVSYFLELENAILRSAQH